MASRVIHYLCSSFSVISYLCGAALFLRSQCTGLLTGWELGALWPAALLLAVLLPPAVALLALLHHAVAAQRLFRLLEAPALTACLGRQDGLHALQAAWAELPVVDLVAAGGAGEHDVVSVIASRDAGFVVLWVVLQI